MSSEEKTQILSDKRVDVGTQLSGIYELDQRIALGGMGEVYRGHNIQTGDPVAIKIVLPELARDETILSLFKKEASILNHLSHEAIVRYHVFTIDPGIGRPYLAMEFVNGRSLLDVMDKGPMAPADARRLCARVAAGLAAAHEAGIIHRDLSPDNVILPDGRVEKAKIIDFGIARSAIVGGKTLLEGKFAGKYNYVSPEQLGLFGGEVSERSDTYSLGLVIAAALLGQPLDMSGSQLDIIEKRRTVPDLSGIDSDLRPLLEAMLRPDPADRPASMADIVAWLSQPAGAATATRPPATEPPATAAPGNGESPFGAYAPTPETPFTRDLSPPPAARRRSTRFALVATAALVVVAASGGAYYLDLLGLRSSSPVEESVAEEEPLFAQTEPAETAEPQEEVAAESPAEESEPAPEQHAALEPPAEQAALPREEAPVMDMTEILDNVASRVSWIRDYAGDGCFYATAMAVSDRSVEIEGFGRTVAPFEALLEDFRSTFDVEPQIGARLIEPEQCAVTAFLRQASHLPASAPVLTLQETIIPSGGELHGRIAKLNGRKADLILIDHKGMAYSLNSRLTQENGTASFTLGVALSSADLAANGTSPQLVVAMVSDDGIAAADFTRPVNAEQLLPRLLEELARSQGTAVAKYFRLGG